MTDGHLLVRGWEIFSLGVFCLALGAAQIVTGRDMVWRKGKPLPDWEPRDGYPFYLSWGFVSMTAFGVFSVVYGISEVLKHST